VSRSDAKRVSFKSYKTRFILISLSPSHCPLHGIPLYLAKGHRPEWCLLKLDYEKCSTPASYDSLHFSFSKNCLSFVSLVQMLVDRSKLRQTVDCALTAHTDQRLDTFQFTFSKDLGRCSLWEILIVLIWLHILNPIYSQTVTQTWTKPCFEWVFEEFSDVTFTTHYFFYNGGCMWGCNSPSNRSYSAQNADTADRRTKLRVC
jgi:hypothetical protein